MKLLKTKIGELTRTVTGGDLLEAKLNYSVEKSWGDLAYKGPKIPRDVWGIKLPASSNGPTTPPKAKRKSGCSSLPSTDTWAAWAFPQEGYAGLHSKEIQDDEFKRQRAALFDQDDDWYAWGTVHSHANVSAFQSGTDESDEEGQGGLHITVGNMSDKHYTFHARLYHQKDMYEPDMSLFWDVGDPFKDLAPEIRVLLPETPMDKLARVQMCIPVTVEFPQQWKDNYRKPEVAHSGFKGKSIPPNGFLGEAEFEKWIKDGKRNHTESPYGNGVGANDPWYLRLSAAVEETVELGLMYNIEDNGLIEVLNYMSAEVPEEILGICKQYGVLPQEILAGIRKLDEAMAQKEKELQSELQTGID